MDTKKNTVNSVIKIDTNEVVLVDYFKSLVLISGLVQAHININSSQFVHGANDHEGNSSKSNSKYIQPRV
jgi:hypothetical protein